MYATHTSHRTHTLGRARVAAGKLVLLAAISALPGGALAQSSPPAYPQPYTSLPDADANSFWHWGVAPTLVVPTAALQAVINAQAGNLDFVAISDVAPGLSSVSVGSQFEHVLQLVTGETTGPYSEFLLSATALNLRLGRPEALTFARWNSNAAFFNDFFGSSVSTPAEFKWDIEQEEGMQVLKLKVKGSDGFQATLKSRIPQTLGFHIRLDPAPITGRLLSDGPLGSHPTSRLALDCDLIFVEPGKFEGFEAGDVLRLRGGKLPITSVQPGFVARSCAAQRAAD